MIDTEEYKAWLESRRLITAQLTALDAAIRELDVRVDRNNEISRERTFEMVSKLEAEIAEAQMRDVARRSQAPLWSGAIGLLTGGLATAIVQLFAAHVLGP